MNIRPTRMVSRGSSRGDPTSRWQRPLTRRAVWWRIAFGIPLAVMLAGGGVILWTVYRDSRSPTAMSLGVTLFTLGFAASATCLGAWLVSGGHRGPWDGR